MARVLKREAAKRDLIGHFVYLAGNASLEVARRFADAARNTFSELALIAYRPLKDGVVIERVFHGAQDYHRVLK
jgi:plasmid stabilization system protein ParE